MSSTGEAISSQIRSNSEVDAFAVAIGELLCGYLSAIRVAEGARSAGRCVRQRLGAAALYRARASSRIRRRLIFLFQKCR